MNESKEPDKKRIIHVVFGPGGGRLEPEVHAKGQHSPRRERPEGTEPLSEVYTRAEVMRLLGMTESRLRTLDKSGAVSPTARRRGRRAYSFEDLISLRTAQALLEKKVRLRDVTRAVELLREELPKVKRPLNELRIVSDGKRVVVRADEGAYEPISGQMSLDFEVRDLRDDVVRVLRPSAGRERASAAYDLYLRASELDEDPATMEQAVRLYEKALELDPWLAIAHTNLGNIAFRRQDPVAAEARYRRALEIEDNQPEAKYNLGYLMLERGEPGASIEFFLGALESDPQFADAYFNLAMAYEQTGQAELARPLWQSYIALEPRGTWTEIARRHL